MKNSSRSIVDANEAVASVAYRLSENIAIYPITPSSPMAEFSDEWASAGKPNLWKTVPEVVQLQSEAGVAGAVHGALTGGTLTTTFTASQGLLLMIPNMYKIAGELTAFAMHVTARSLATHALSIFGDHSDVMACRQTGFAMLASNTVQEAQDLACIAHAATLKSRVPFLHFFDGFRTSHEINTITPLTDADLRAMVDEKLVNEHRARGLTPDSPMIRGTAQNPDVFFQAREAANGYYDATPGIVQATMDQFAKVTGRSYKLFEYVGNPAADRVLVVMGSGAETCTQAAAWLNAQGAKVGVLKVRLFRPFSLKDFISVLPRSVKRIAVLDRTKEPGALGEPLYQDVVTAIADAKVEGLLPETFNPRITGGRYGLGSKEFTPAMVKAIFDDLADSRPHSRFTVGIVDDVTHLSLPYDASFDLEPQSVFRAVFFGLGSDGTVGANKNTIKIIGDETDNYAQAYFVYDSKKSGAMTVSHLRFGPEPIEAPYLIQSAQFVGCHQAQFLQQYDVLSYAAPGAVFLLNSVYGPDKVWEQMPREVQESIIERKLRFYTIDAYKVAKDTGMGGRINTIMQTCFFAISGILPRDEAIANIKKAIKKTYSKKGEAVVQKNFEAVDTTISHLYEVKVPAAVTAKVGRPPVVPAEAPDFVQRVTSVMMAGKGDLLPVSAFPIDGTWPTATSRWEKRGVALEIPTWDASICIQCAKCALVCPHAAIRSKFFPSEAVKDAPEGFAAVDFKAREWPGQKFTIQVSPDDCTGCQLCVAVCPAKDKTNPRHKALDMVPVAPIQERERKNWKFFLDLPNPDRTKLGDEVKMTQMREPLFEFSGACAGCGETPYIKLLSQLFGDRLLIANATGCSSIYGGNLPTTPYTVDANGRGPAWANSLFEDNAEFGFGLRLAVDKKAGMAKELLRRFAAQLGEDRVRGLLEADQASEAGIAMQRARVADLREALKSIKGDESVMLNELADYLVQKSVWVVGGDGWAYDIGFGGLDHVIATGRKINILVLDTEVYSNTGGQQSKSTPIAAVAKFAAGGKSVPKKDLGQIAMGYGHVYVACVALGAKDSHTVQALMEADAYPGPSLVIAYSHCIAHGYNLNCGLEQQKLAVNTGYWPLYRFDPRRFEAGQPALKLDCAAPKVPLSKYLENEARFRMLAGSQPDRAHMLSEMAQRFVTERFSHYQGLANIPGRPQEGAQAPAAAGTNGAAAPVAPAPTTPTKA